MNYQALYDFIEDISQNLGLTTKFFHGRLEILNLESDFQGLNIHCLPFTASGNTTEGAQINTSWVVRILFLQQDKCDSAIDQNDQDVIQDEIKTLATTQQAAEMFLRLVHENDINDDLEKAADQLTINSFDFDNETKIAQLMTGTMLTMNITVPDNFDYCDAVFTPVVPITSFEYSDNNQTVTGAITPMFATVVGDVSHFMLDANDSLPTGISLNLTTGEVTGSVTADPNQTFDVTVLGVNEFTSATVRVTFNPQTSAPATWDEFVSEYGRGYAYPQPTGQSISYRTGDDADIESTIFAPTRQANELKPVNSLASFLVLNETNSFGNTNRFTDSVGAQNYDGTGGSIIDYVVDNLTGLAFYRIAQAAANWNTAIDNALAFSLGGFSDYFLTNIPQILSVMQYNSAITRTLNYAPFNLSGFTSVWVSTTRPDSTTNSFRVVDNSGEFVTFAKTSTRVQLFCRKHF